MKIELILSIAGFVLALSGFNVANAINSFIKDRKGLIIKINKIIEAIKTLSSHQQEITDKYNEVSEELFQIKNFLQTNHGFVIKQKSPDTIKGLNPFDSLELDLSITEQGDLTK